MSTVLLAGSLALVLSLLLTALVKTVALRVGLVAVPHADRWHRQRVPLLGGVAIGLSVAIATVLIWPSTTAIWILLGAGLTLLVVGVIDDIRPIKPQSKLIAQILVAAVLAGLGLQLRLSGYPLVDILITLFWIVGITNAFNLLDNMDGLAAGIAVITAGFRLVFFLTDGNVEGATFAAIVAGAALGFLVHNFHPASIFMGDAGSLFLGAVVSGLSLVGGWPYSRGTVSVLLLPVLILLVPIFDTTFVTLVRTVAGRPVSLGGRDHTSHRLVALGLSERHAVLLLYAVGLASGAVAYFSYRYGLSYSVVLIALLGIGLGLLGVYLGRLQVYPADQVKLTESTRFVSLIADFSYKRQVAAVFIDFVLVILAYYTAYLLRFEEAFDRVQEQFIESLPIVIACQVGAFALFRVYMGVWRYTSLRDLIRLAQAATAGAVASVLVTLFVYRFEGYSRAVFVLDWLLLLGFVSASRLFFRILGELLKPASGNLQPVLVYGAGDGGVMVLREIANNRSLGKQVIGFLDDERTKHRTAIQGVMVLGGVEQLETLLATREVSQVIVSTGKVVPEHLAELESVCAANGVTVMRASLKFE